MSETSGVALVRNASSEITHVTIDVQQHKAVLAILEQWNLVERESFDAGICDGYGIEESRRRSHETINRLWQE